MELSKNRRCYCATDASPCSGEIVDAFSENDVNNGNYTYRVNSTQVRFTLIQTITLLISYIFTNFRRYKLNRSRCTSKADCLRDRLNLKPSAWMLLMCQKHLYDYTDNYTPNGYRAKGRRKIHCAHIVPIVLPSANSIEHQSTSSKKQWGQDALIGTPAVSATMNASKSAASKKNQICQHHRLTVNRQQSQSRMPTVSLLYSAKRLFTISVVVISLKQLFIR